MEQAREVRTTCPYCGVGCGVLARRAPDGTVTVRGDPDHPANFGRLCSKGSALGETVGLEDRLLHPHVHGHRAGWDRALDLVASTFAKAIAEHGPDSVAIYGSGQLLTEDYYVANKLMKGFIGSANIDTNSRLCMASAVAGHRRAFGSDTVPGTYEDLELADLVVLVGSNLAWCHPVLYQRLVAAKEKRPQMKVVLIDPRRTATAEIADLHLPIAADGDVALFCALLAFLEKDGRVDRAYVDTHTSGFNDALEAARAVDDIIGRTGLSERDLSAFYRLFAETEKVVTVYSQGVNQSSCGTDKVSAILNCHLATGRIGRPGMGPFSVTGQPNAMGGREVGGLANVLAAHMDLDNPEHRARVQRFWNAPAVAEKPGLKAVDLFRAIAAGRIKALWIMATNPAVSMPDAGAVEIALRTCPFVVVSDMSINTDTARHAHVLLPAAGWGEKDGTVTNSERRISRQRSFLPLSGEAKPDWWIVSEVGKRMGFSAAFSFTSPAEIFSEHAALSAFENAGERDFDIGAHAGIDTPAYDALAPFQWPAARDAEGGGRFFADGGFFTPDRKARFVALTPPARQERDATFPFILNTGRVRDHWHTMTRTGKSPRLSQHLAEPFAEINPADAARAGIADTGIVRVSSPSGSVLMRALVTKRVASGTIFAPMHWNDAFACNARVDTLVPPTTDPLSGQPALKSAAVCIEPFAAQIYGFAVVREKPAVLDADYWALAICEGGWRIELAFSQAVRDWAQWAQNLFGDGADMLSLRDEAAGRLRFAAFVGERLAGALYLAPEPVAVARGWAAEQLRLAHTSRRARLAVAAGRPSAGEVDRGAIVCACFGVGANQIAAAARAGCRTVAAIGAATQAGTNCGSCRAEIRRIVDAHRLQAAE